MKWYKKKPILIYMVEYECEKCHKKFDKKSNYETHKKKKFPCVSETIKIDENGIKKYICEYCNYEFSRSYLLKKHLEGKCKIKNDLLGIPKTKAHLLNDYK